MVMNESPSVPISGHKRRISGHTHLLIGAERIECAQIEAAALAYSDRAEGYEEVCACRHEAPTSTQKVLVGMARDGEDPIGEEIVTHLPSRGTQGPFSSTHRDLISAKRSSLTSSVMTASKRLAGADPE